MFSAYIHYPFCRHLCEFCGYETRLVDKELISRFAAKIQTELERYRLDDFQVASLRSIFFGGGTASLMSNSLLRACIESLRSLSSWDQCPELTLECEPGTISAEKLKGAVDAGINRISVCAQSLEDDILKGLGRKHKASHSLKLIEHATLHGLENIHIDLMYSLPNQSARAWEQTLLAATELPVKHISAYRLYVFKHGPLHRSGLKRAVDEAPDDTVRSQEMLRMAQEILSSRGFVQYSLTEFALPGWRCDYLENCFDGDDVLPLGPGAFGRCGRDVWENSPYVSSYVSRQDILPIRGIALTNVETFKRDVILGLWLLTVDVEQLAERHSVSISEELRDLLTTLCNQGLITLSETCVSLLPNQVFDAGTVMARLDALPTSQWASTTSVVRADAPISSTPNSLKGLRQVARVARRDAELFNNLRFHPSKTLRALGYDVTEVHIRQLVEAIENRHDAGVASTEAGRFWRAIEHEHETPRSKAISNRGKGDSEISVSSS